MATFNRKFPIWLSSTDAVFPQSLVRNLVGKIPARIAAIGNLEILTTKPVALVCSVKCPGAIILQTYDLSRKLRDSGVPVIGGFHSPMERECLHILLKGRQPIIVCPARTLEGMRVNQELQDPLEQGRLLFLSPFQKNNRRATVQNARYRNQFVCALADSVLVPYAAPSSKSFELCRENLFKGKSVYTFSDPANAESFNIGAKSLGNSLDFFNRLSAD